MSTVFDAIVIGAGQAGLAAGYHLQRTDLRFTILEAASQATGSWPYYYDSLTLFSPARYSSLPGLPFPGTPNHYPMRDEVIAYLTSYAAYFKLPVITNSHVKRVEQVGTLFRVITAAEELYYTHSLIAATGSFHQPNLPQLPEQAAFQGNILHSASYRTPEPFRDQRVIVVGAGNSAVQISLELSQVARVTLATRRPVTFWHQHILGQDIHFWSRLIGIERLPLGRWLELSEPRLVLDTGVYQAALAAGKPDRQLMFTRFTTQGVIWPDGSNEAVDTVIFATGFRPNLGFLADLGALNEGGRALQRAGASLTTAGLYYIGLSGQRSFASATLRGVGVDAAYVVAHLQRYLQKAPRGAVVH